jgi:hypothetical protein
MSRIRFPGEPFPLPSSQAKLGENNCRIDVVIGDWPVVCPVFQDEARETKCAEALAEFDLSEKLRLGRGVVQGPRETFGVEIDRLCERDQGLVVRGVAGIWVLRAPGLARSPLSPHGRRDRWTAWDGSGSRTRS